MNEAKNIRKTALISIKDAFMGAITYLIVIISSFTVPALIATGYLAFMWSIGSRLWKLIAF